MKLVVIIAIAVVLLIPLTVFAQVDPVKPLVSSIRELVANDQFEEALELVEEAKKHPDSELQLGILQYESQILAKMSRHQEALDVLREYIERHTELLPYDIPYFNEAILLYHLGKYSEASEKMSSNLADYEQYMPESPNKKMTLGTFLFSYGMILEKTGDTELAEQAYAKHSEYVTGSSRDCTKVRTLMFYGGYAEAMQIINNMDAKILCYGGTVESLKVLAQDRINTYQPYASITASLNDEPIIISDEDKSANNQIIWVFVIISFIIMGFAILKKKSSSSEGGLDKRWNL